jgi:hypothetical protein
MHLALRDQCRSPAPPTLCDVFVVLFAFRFDCSKLDFRP